MGFVKNAYTELCVLTSSFSELSCVPINTTGGASMDITGAGKYIAAISNLGNINYWVGVGAITGNGIVGNVNVDTLTDPTKVILTVTPPDCTADIPGDISGPEGVPDCSVDIYDIIALASDWLTCSLVPQTACWEQFE